jgi:uncharacterized damage-inducible protein DinB
LDLLYAYNEWANARLLGAAARLPTALLTRELGSSHASVWGTLRHIVWAEWRWLGRWQTRAPAGPDPLACQDLAALQHRAGEIASQQRAFLRRLTPVDLERLVSYENPPGTRWTYALGDMVQHLVNHSTYHRGQVAAMLRQLGNAPPATDYLVYLDEGAAGAGPPAPGAT